MFTEHDMGITIVKKLQESAQSVDATPCRRQHGMKTGNSTCRVALSHIDQEKLQLKNKARLI